MDIKIKEKLPQWFMEETPKELILSNDIDSLLSVRLLEQVRPNWKLKYFYDFESGIYRIENTDKKSNDIVGVDIALEKSFKTFDNHVTSDNCNGINPYSINFNNVYGISSQNYFRKYCGSTALLIYSLFDIPLPTSEIGKALLLTIDSTYYSYYNSIARNRPDWLEIHQHWLCDILGFPELYEIEQSHSMEDFRQLCYINDAKIQIFDDLLDGHYQIIYPLDNKFRVEKALDVCLEVPSESFSLVKKVRAKSCYLNGLHKSDLKDKYRILSFAMTGKKHCNFSALSNNIT